MELWRDQCNHVFLTTEGEESSRRQTETAQVLVRFLPIAIPCRDLTVPPAPGSHHIPHDRRIIPFVGIFPEWTFLLAAEKSLDLPAFLCPGLACRSRALNPCPRPVCREDLSPQQPFILWRNITMAPFQQCLEKREGAE